jgi:hypothetical protein
MPYSEFYASVFCKSSVQNKTTYACGGKGHIFACAFIIISDVSELKHSHVFASTIRYPCSKTFSKLGDDGYEIKRFHFDLPTPAVSLRLGIPAVRRIHSDIAD